MGGWGGGGEPALGKFCCCLKDLERTKGHKEYIGYIHFALCHEKKMLLRCVDHLSVTRIWSKKKKKQS